MARDALKSMNVPAFRAPSSNDVRHALGYREGIGGTGGSRAAPRGLSNHALWLKKLSVLADSLFPALVKLPTPRTQGSVGRMNVRPVDRRTAQPTYRDAL
jgi:hypothetical protein